MELLLALRNIMMSLVSSHTINVSYFTQGVVNYLIYYFLSTVINFLCFSPSILSVVSGTNVEPGSIIQAVVLDIANAEHLVDLSLKQEFNNKLKESSNSQTHKKVKCIPCLYLPFLV